MEDSKESQGLAIIIDVLNSLPDDQQHQFKSLLNDAQELLATMALNRLNRAFDLSALSLDMADPNMNKLEADMDGTMNELLLQSIAAVRNRLVEYGLTEHANTMLALLSSVGLEVLSAVSSQPVDVVETLLGSKRIDEIKNASQKPVKKKRKPLKTKNQQNQTADASIPTLEEVTPVMKTNEKPASAVRTSKLSKEKDIPPPKIKEQPVRRQKRRIVEKSPLETTCCTESALENESYLLPAKSPTCLKPVISPFPLQKKKDPSDDYFVHTDWRKRQQRKDTWWTPLPVIEKQMDLPQDRSDFMQHMCQQVLDRDRREFLKQEDRIQAAIQLMKISSRDLSIFTRPKVYRN
ncbi:hypothetical protein BJ741DRAFT_669702 [Chytriomyces cf. hyalinus JEL632]|nr:hypothetical protein BJ741DRAFT_669702 [Chytriomyces cf. hyalinus JEL632]